VKKRSAAKHPEQQTFAGRLEALQRVLGVTFLDPGLLERALTHRTYVNEYPDEPGDNERLEFLGDAALELSVSEMLFEQFPEAGEGVLSRARARTVCAETLAGVARHLGLGEMLRLGRGEEQTGGRQKDSVLSDAFEAVLGAVYVDQGLEAVRRVVRGQLGGVLGKPQQDLSLADPRTRLQERVQSRGGQLPVYSLLEPETRGEMDARPWFRVAVSVDGRVLAAGEGRSKKEASRAAAALALEVLGPEVQLP
jgi:ribonuclease-3